MSAYGCNGYIGFCFQNSFGEVQANSFHYIPFVSESFTRKKPLVEDDRNYGRLDQEDSFEGMHEITGEVVFYPDANEIGVPMFAWLGKRTAPTSDTGIQVYSANPETSDFDDNKAAVVPMTVEVYRAVGSNDQYYDMCCNEVTVEVAAGELVKVTMGMIGGKFDKTAQETPTFSTAKEFMWDATSVSINGAGADECTGLTINLNNNLEAIGTLSASKLPSRVRRSGKKRSIEISGTLLYENDTFADICGSLSNVPFITTMVTSDNNKFRLTMPAFKFSEYPVNMGGTGAIEVSFAGECTYHSGSETAMAVYIVNSMEGGY